MNGIVTNISNSEKTLKNLIAGAKIKYCDHKHLYANTKEGLVETIPIIAMITEIKEKSPTAETIIFVELTYSCKMEIGLMLVLKRAIEKTNIGIVFLLHSDKNELELNYFPLQLKQLFMFSDKVFSFDANMKYKVYRLP